MKYTKIFAQSHILFTVLLFHPYKADLREYFHLEQEDEVAMVVQDTIVDEKAKFREGRVYTKIFAQSHILFTVLLFHPFDVVWLICFCVSESGGSFQIFA